MPCWELFEKQSEKYRRKILPAGPVRVAIEAGSRMGWDRWLSGERGSDKKSFFIGMTGFGSSAPAERLYEEFSITAEATVKAVRTLLKIED
jgi:transketolase